jgi:hypothetical protein
MCQGSDTLGVSIWTVRETMTHRELDQARALSQRGHGMHSDREGQSQDGSEAL